MDDKRKRLKVYYKESHRIFAQWRANGYQYPPPITPVFPEDLRGMTCGARTKATGEPCKRKDIYENGRCKLHGGLSTGPKTKEGKRKVALNGLKAKSMRS